MLFHRNTCEFDFKSVPSRPGFSFNSSEGEKNKGASMREGARARGEEGAGGF